MKRYSHLAALLGASILVSPAFAYTPGPNIFYSSQAGTTEAGLLAADAGCAARSQTCILDAQYTTTADRTLNAHWVGGGGKISSGSHALTFSAGFSAPPDIVSFDSAGTGLITIAGSGPVYAGWFSSWNTSNDTNAFNRWIASAVASKSAAIGDLGYTATVTSGVTLPPSIPYDFNGMAISPASSMTSGCVVTEDGVEPGYTGAYRSTLSDLRVLQALTSNHADPSRNLDGFCLGSANGAYEIALNHLRVEGFRDAVVINGPNAYIIDFDNASIINNWRRGVAFLATSNSGENISFSHSTIANTNNTSFNGVGLYIDPATFNGEFFIESSSFDYNDICLEDHVGAASVTDSHFESNNNNPCVELIKTSSKVTPDFIMQGGLMGPGPGSSSWTGIPTENSTGRPAYITTTGAANVIVNGVKFGTFNTTDQVTEIVKVASGTPRRLDIRPSLDAGFGTGSSAPVPISYSLNALNVSTTDLSTWTQNSSSGTTQSFDGTTVFSPDVGARKTVSTSGNSSSFVAKNLVPVRPGQSIEARAYINAPTFTSGGYLAIQVKFYAQDGVTQIGSGLESTHITAATAGYVPAWIYTQVPNGAAYASFADYTNLFTGTDYFSNEHMWAW